MDVIPESIDHSTLVRIEMNDSNGNYRPNKRNRKLTMRLIFASQITGLEMSKKASGNDAARLRSDCSMNSERKIRAKDQAGTVKVTAHAQ